MNWKKLKKVNLFAFIFIFLFTIIGISDVNGNITTLLASNNTSSQINNSSGIVGNSSSDVTPNINLSKVNSDNAVTQSADQGKGNSLDTVTQNTYQADQADITNNVYGLLKGKKGDKTVVREIKENRTRNSKHYLLADGSYKAEISTGEIHYEDENGHFQDINTDLVDEGDIDLKDVPFSKEVANDAKLIRGENKIKGKNNKIDKSQTDFRALQVPFNVDLPKKYSKGYSMSKGSDKLTFKPVSASSVSGVIDVTYKNQMNYINAWNQTDVKLGVTNEGVKETLILKNRSAPSMFSFEVSGELADDLTTGNLKVEPAWLQDAEGKKGDVSQVLRKVGNKTYLDLKANTDGLQYPITIDPTVALNRVGLYGSVTRSGTSWVPSTLYDINPYNDFYVRAGFESSTNKYYLMRSFVSYDTSSIPTVANIYSATLSSTYWVNDGNNGYRTMVDLYNYNPGSTIDNYDFDAPATLVGQMGPITTSYTLISNSISTSAINKGGITYWRYQLQNESNPVNASYQILSATPTLNVMSLALHK